MTNKTTMKVLYRFVPFCVAASMMTTVAAVGMLKPNKAKVLVAELQGVNSEVFRDARYKLRWFE
jgi:hypothetical protein